SAEMILDGLDRGYCEYDGEFVRQPRKDIRPRPEKSFRGRTYAAAVSSESAEIMAKLGFGMMVIMQNEWKKAAADIESFRDIAISVGHTPRPPVILTNVSCAESRDEADERAMRYLGAKWDSIDNHYHFSDGHLANVKGYESYGKMAKTYSKLKDKEAREKMTRFYVNIQIVGTPDDCIQQMAELQRLTGTDHVVCDFSYGGMPHEQGELNMRLFADRVMPTLQRDAAFQGSSTPAAEPLAKVSGDVFAPA
ncbi:MAG: LLM class flavin-dependent oxidoreductase, partial [Pseudomonadota bacterium]